VRRAQQPYQAYGGSGDGNLRAVEAAPVPYHGWPYSLTLMVPPLAVVFFTALQENTNTADSVSVVA
jgi:hypothetical protein